MKRNLVRAVERLEAATGGRREDPGEFLPPAVCSKYIEVTEEKDGEPLDLKAIEAELEELLKKAGGDYVFEDPS